MTKFQNLIAKLTKGVLSLFYWVKRSKVRLIQTACLPLRGDSLENRTATAELSQFLCVFQGTIALNYRCEAYSCESRGVGTFCAREKGGNTLTLLHIDNTWKTRVATLVRDRLCVCKCDVYVSRSQ